MSQVAKEAAIESRADHTKKALIDAGLRLFGDKGFENTTIRDLISAADVNLASINYHFGGKEGLRFAVIEHLAEQFRKDGPGSILSDLNPELIEEMNKDEARAMLRKVMKFSFMRSAQMEGADIKSRFIQRELIQGGKPTEMFFEKIFKLQLGLMRALVARVTGEKPGSDIVKMRAINLVAQSVFLNLARPLVLMAMDWDSYSPNNAELVADAFWLFHE